MSSLEIIGLGTALPEYAIDQKEAAQLAVTYAGASQSNKRVLSRLYTKTDIASRHSVVQKQFYPVPEDGNSDGPTTETRMLKYEAEVIPLAVRAASQAIARAAVAAHELTHLVTISCTGFFAPGVDIALIKQLALNPEVNRFHLGFMGCHGALNGINLARSICDSTLSAALTPARSPTILLCAAELCSLHYQYGWNADNILANSIFADGAAALVLRSKQPEGRKQATSTPGALSTVISSASCVLPDSEEAMSWHIGNNGFKMTISNRISELIKNNLSSWLATWLHKSGLSICDINSWAVHPGGPKILDAVEESLQLPADALADSRQVLNECGNMSSPTVLFVLEKLRARNAQGPCVMLGFGPGLVIEAALVL